MAKKKKKMTPDEAIKDAEKRGIKFADDDSRPDLEGIDSLDFNLAKVRISTMIDLNVKTNLEDLAAEKGTKYQTLLNEILVDFFNKRENESIVKEIESIKKEMEKMKRQLKKVS